MTVLPQPVSLWLNDLLGLFYPNLCYACGQNLPAGQSDPVCLTCHYKLPRTDHHLHAENAFTERLWGRLELQSAAAFFQFVKDGRVQRLLYHLKYNGKREVGLYLGKLYGAALKSVPAFQSVDAIVPVPLHPRKEKIRGYNQADWFARGLSETMQRPVIYALKRTVFTQTQTRMTRAERQVNVSRAFELSASVSLPGKHVLLVDDVVTTGATLEACGARLLQHPGLQLSMAAIAIAD
ncbi:MAG: phosphoribosyltransferase family protein [Phaeodactylibacter sp.]|uniref:ComF family protein n=1 Tax=Phaeodactylibacter sp. TaxID=1940289 RepID=UPI0032EC595A